MGTKKINGNLEVSGSITSEGYAVESVENRVSSIDSQSTNTQYPSAKAVYDEIQEVIEKAEGKSESFVLSYDATVTGTYEDYSYMDVNGELHDFSSASQFEQWLEGKTCLNSAFNSNNNTITLVESDKISPTKYLIINGDSKPILALVSYLYAIVKKGYIFLVTELDVADRWVSSYFEATPEVDIVLSKMETSKVDLSGYPTKAGNETITGQWTFNNDVNIKDYTFKQNSGGTLALEKNGNALIYFSTDYGVIVNNALRPSTNNIYDLGNSSYTWKDIYLSGALKIGVASLQDIDGYLRISGRSLKTGSHVAVDNSSDLGSSLYKWRDLYLSRYLFFPGTSYSSYIVHEGNRLKFYYGDVERFRIGNSEVVSTNPILPSDNDTYDLGGSTVKWKNLFLSNLINPNSSNYGISLPDTAGYTQNHEVLVSNEDIDLGNYTLKAISLGNTVIDAETMTLEELYTCLQHDSQSGVSTGIVTFKATNYPNLKGIWAICATLSASTPIRISFWGKCLTSDYYLNKFTISRTAAESAFLSDYYSQVEADKVFIDSYADVSLTVGDLAQEENQGYVKIKWRRTDDSSVVSEFRMSFAANTGTQVVALTLFYPNFNQYEYIATIDADTPLNTLLNNITTYGTGNMYDLGAFSAPWRDLYLGGSAYVNSIRGTTYTGTGFDIASGANRSIGHIYPNADNNYSLGVGVLRWKDIYFAGSLKDGTYSFTIAQSYNILFNRYFADNSMTSLGYERPSVISLSADRTFTFATAPTGCIPEYKAIITNSGSSTITLTFNTVSSILCNNENCVITNATNSTLTLPAGTTIECSILNGKMVAIDFDYVG